MIKRLAVFVTMLALAVGVFGTIAIAATTAGGETSSSAGQLDKPGKHCGDANHLGQKEDACKGGGPKR